MIMQMENKNYWWKIFLAIWILIFLYLLLMNSGLLGVKIKYDVAAEHPFISNFWPRSAYEIDDNGNLNVHDSLYLDLDLNTNFEKMSVFCDGLAFSDTKIQLLVKPDFDGAAIYITDLKIGQWQEIDLSALGRSGLLILSLDHEQSYQISNFQVHFTEPRWLNWFN